GLNRSDGTVKTELLGFGQAFIDIWHMSDLAGKTDLAEHGSIAVELQPLGGRPDSQADGQVRRRFVDLQATDDIDVYILISQGEFGAALQHGDEQIET